MKVGKVDRRNCKKIERTSGPLCTSSSEEQRSREGRDSVSEVTSSWQRRSTLASRAERWQTASSARIRPKNSSFNSALSYRLIHWPGLFFNLCHRVVREINRTRTMLHSSDGTRFVFRDRGLIYRRDRRRQCNAVTTGSNETKREIERSLPIFLSTWTTSFVPTNR